MWIFITSEDVRSWRECKCIRSYLRGKLLGTVRWEDLWQMLRHWLVHWQENLGWWRKRRPGNFPSPRCLQYRPLSCRNRSMCVWESKDCREIIWILSINDMVIVTLSYCLNVLPPWSQRNSSTFSEMRDGWQDWCHSHVCYCEATAA